jgi:hypothetical protein
MTRPTRATPRQATSPLAFEPVPPPPADDPLLAFAPYLHKQPRRNSITPELQRRFVAALAATGIVNQAARTIGKSMEALYKLRARPGAEGFAAAWDEALGGARLDGGDAMLMFVLRQRSAFRVDARDVVPGHPLYERIRAEVLAARGE